ncbi:unnamed protein product [Danaus chrysippus]|uniref:(African queen) hypothetical protein n=1 Tax=Danaus chrysippus TaxID=151541 RepID=A0A8J2QJZ6_9NEOP|nr:unnamed protein product [Danaus chrysippus]
MANDEVLGPRKTMFVLVIVVGCFAVLWPRILSPFILGTTSDHLKPNKFDREAGCCEVIFETEVAILELVNEVCNPVLGDRIQSAAECLKAVNDTCGLDIAAFVKRSDNVGKTTKMLVENLKNSNSSCLRTNFGVPVYSLSTHFAVNSWQEKETVKQERPPIRVGAHPAMRERGRAIPPTPPGTPPKPVALPPHVRVRSLSPLSVYYDLDIKPPPIPGMRPPLGSPGGPVPAPKSSMGFVMPIYTICIIVFFVYTLSKILFKRAATPYDPVPPDPQFRRRVFRDDSRTTPDKLGDAELAALRARLAETERAMQRIVGQLAQRNAVPMHCGSISFGDKWEALDSTRQYTNGTILHNSGPVHIVTSEYREAKENTPELQKDKEVTPEPETKETSPVTQDSSPQGKSSLEENIKEEEKLDLVTSEEKSDLVTSEEKSEDLPKDEKVTTQENAELDKETPVIEKDAEEKEKLSEEVNEILAQSEVESLPQDDSKLTEENELGTTNTPNKASKDFLNEERKELIEETESTQKLLEEAIDEDPVENKEITDKENQVVKVVGMETTAHHADGGAWRVEPPRVVPPQRPHESEPVQSIFLETEIPQQSRVLISDFEDRSQPSKDASLVVSGKITLSLIQDAPRDTPDRDLESQDDFTTASAATHHAEKEDEVSDEEIEEEIEIEEIEEEVEEEEEEEEEKPIKTNSK